MRKNKEIDINLFLYACFVTTKLMDENYKLLRAWQLYRGHETASSVDAR